MTSPLEPALAARVGTALLAKIRSYAGTPVAVMEVCGTHTVAIARLGLRTLLPPAVRLLSGPGCPVCVAPESVFAEAVHLAKAVGLTVATFGDAVRIPGPLGSLAEARAAGSDVRIVYSVTDALAIAVNEPHRQVCFLGLGFETTAPSVAWAVTEAARQGLRNFSVLCAHRALLPALRALAEDEESAVGGLLLPGHASMVLGAQAYRFLSEEYRVPCVVAGFEPNDVLVALERVLAQVQRREARVENAYPRAVSDEGNTSALGLLAEVFEPEEAEWRGLGVLARSGYGLRQRFEAFDARRRYLAGASLPRGVDRGCGCARVLRGRLAPEECPLFGTRCTPASPVGPCMVSSEGACGATFRFRSL